METFENEELGIEVVFDVPQRGEINYIVSLADYLIRKGHSELFITRTLKTLRLLAYTHTLHIDGNTVDIPKLPCEKEPIKIGWSKRKVNKLLKQMEIELDEVQYITLTKMCDEYKDSIDPYEKELQESGENFIKTSQNDIISLREEAKKIFGWENGRWLRKSFEECENANKDNSGTEETETGKEN